MLERRNIYHVVSADEGVIDGDELDIVALQSHSRHKPTNPTKPYINQKFTPSKNSNRPANQIRFVRGC